MAHLPEHGAILVHRRSDHTITGGNESIPGSLHQAIDSSRPGILKIEVATGDSQTSAGGAADVVVRKRNAAGSALVDSTDPDRSGLDSVLDIARDGSGIADVAGRPDRRPTPLRMPTKAPARMAMTR
jgi:hypothetical protein